MSNEGNYLGKQKIYRHW